MYHESFRNAVLSLYHYFGSMRRTASVLKVSDVGTDVCRRRLIREFSEM